MTSQIEIFRQLVREHMDARVVVVERHEPCAAVVAKMASAGASSAVVTERGGKPAGIVTERDVTRRVAFRLADEAPISLAMTSPVATLGDDDFLYRAIARMRRRRRRHMPVVGPGGEVVGMLHLHRALAVASEPMLELIDRLTHERTLAGLEKTKAAQVELAAALMAGNVPAPDILTLLSEINLDLHRRIVELALAEMAELGWGEPPVAFCVVVMGSAGRGESSILTDQDNGLILGDCEASERGRVHTFFVELAERMTRALDRVGIPLCRGDVMATNATWRETLSGWRRQTEGWVGRRTDFNIRLADIFFDFRPACGDDRLAWELRRHVTGLVAANPGFLRDMYDLEADHRVALGPFGQLVTEDDAGREGKIDLKYGGTLPLVEGVRLLALRAGVAETSTLQRLARLGAGGVLSRGEEDYLAGAFALLTGLLLRQQIADFEAGLEVSNLVPEESLSDRERDMMADGFRAVRRLRSRIRSELTGRLF